VVLNKGDKLTSSEISERINISESSVKRIMRKLVKDVSENVIFRPLTPEEKEIKYGHRVGCKIHLYWINN